MTNEERISVFVNEIKKQSENKKQEIIKDSENRINAIVEGGKPAIDTEAQLYFHNECNRFLNENIQGVAKDSARSRRNVIVKRNELTDSVFNTVANKISDFTKTDKYCDYIRAVFAKITEEYSEIECVFARECDKEIVQSVANCDVIADESIVYGGIRAKINNNLVADFTFDTRISAQRNEFARKSGLIVI